MERQDNNSFPRRKVDDDQPSGSGGNHAASGIDGMIGKLTLKQRKFIQAYVRSGNATQAAKDAGFRCTTEASYAEMGSRALRKVESRMCEILVEAGLDNAALAQKAYEALNAIVVKPFAREGVVISERSYIDYPTRAKYLEIIAKMKGLIPAGGRGMSCN